MPKKLNGRELMDIKVLYNIPVTTRDGVTLYADVYRPDNDTPYPAIVNRTPYLKDGVVLWRAIFTRISWPPVVTMW